ncbi:MAG: Fur family transcriptional regulator peroxide stress response regulator [Elusimicrobia bacterium]|nr:MAG: Fur family transcriptional regulator peroxide stress response regulator [Elusimicrobiota bacterium]KAF0156481.1 MAG: Fur family transcriptional regulator peroxide stress response regulator [Elusimicrobiota bacterium]
MKSRPKPAIPAKAHAARRTPQRDALEALLEGNRSHPSAERLHAALRRRFPGLSLATVYNNLQKLVALGRLAELRFDPERLRFDPDLGVHAHLFCLSCGEVADIKRPAPRPPEPRSCGGFRTVHSETVFRGCCRRCAAKKSQTSKASGRRTKPCAKKKKKR